jgi:hypothetical protein
LFFFSLTIYKADVGYKEPLQEDFNNFIS